MLQKISEKLAVWSYRRPLLTLLLALSFTAIMAAFAVKIELHNDFVELLPPSMPQVKTIREVLSETGGVSYQAVMVTSPDREKNRLFLKNLREKILKFFWDYPHLTFSQRLDGDYQRWGEMLRHLVYYSRHPSKELREQLLEKIEKFPAIPMVHYVRVRYPVEFFKKRGLLFMEPEDLREIYRRLKEKIRYETKKRQPGYVDILGEEDPGLDFTDIEEKYRGKLSKFSEWIEVKHGEKYSNALMIRPRGASTDLIFAQEFLKRLDGAIKELSPKSYHPEMEIHLIGAYKNNLREYRGISADLTRSIGTTLVLLIGLISVFFRRFRVLFLIPIPLAMGFIWTFGTTYLLIGYLTTVTGFIGALLLGLGIDYGVYFLDRYFTERREGRPPAEAVQICYRWTGTAVATAALTTAAGFFALLVCDFTGFSQFGIIAGVGIVYCLLAMQTVLPALLALIEERFPVKSPRAPFKSSLFRGKRFPLAGMWTGLGVLTIAAAFYYLPRVPSEVNMKRLSFHSEGLERDEKLWSRFDSILPGNAMVPIIFIAEEPQSAEQLPKKIWERVKQYHREHPEFKKKLVLNIITPLDFVPKKQKEKIALISEIRRLLERNDVEEYIEDEEQLKLYKKYRELLQVSAFGVEDLPLSIQKDLLIYHKGEFLKIKRYLIAVVSGVDLSDGNEARRLKDALQNIQIGGKRFDPSGEPIIFAELMHTIEIDSIIAVIASFTAVTLLVLLDLRSLRLTLMAIWPLLTGVLGLTIILSLFDIRVNMFNMIVFPALFGIGVDAGVHTLHRFRERPDLGTLGVLFELLGPISVASVTTLISFASMITAHHLGMKSVGILAVLGLSSCLFSAFVLLPALMELFSGVFTPSEKKPDDSSKK